MNRVLIRVRKPVKRQNAETYLLTTLLSFAASVALIRLFLELTGYPQLGGGGLHIAHVLWGGLLLFIASLLPLILANRWVYLAGSILAGVGVGLFIDEVGKFITQSNDYFFPAAAPIIYAFFLLTVLLYLQVRRPTRRDPRSELYGILDTLEEVLDHDLDEPERVELASRLKSIARETSHPDLARLAGELLEFVQNKELYLAPDLPSFWERIQKRWQAFESRYIRRKVLLASLVGGLVGLSLVSLVRLIQVSAVSFDIKLWNPALTEAFLAGTLPDPTMISWFLLRVGLDAGVGLMLLISAVLLVMGKYQRGLAFGYFSLLLSLTVVNLLVFYFDQFSTIIPAAVQFLLLVGLLYFRRRFLQKQYGGLER